MMSPATPATGGADTPRRIDMHCHAGVLGDDAEYRAFGRISDWMRRQLTFRIFLRYARIPEHDVSDRRLEEAVLGTISQSGLDGVVCLALDPVYDDSGARRADLSHMWVANEYILRLRDKLPSGRLLFGASVHPYDPNFEERVRRYAAEGAVLLKWLPSAQQIDLADEKVRRAMEFLARPLPGKDGKARVLPLLLHVGPEYAIETRDPRTKSFDFLSWTWRDAFRNAFRRRDKWREPRTADILRNLRGARDAGARIIFAHCGLPYFAPGRVGGFFEHSDLDVVRGLLTEKATGGGTGAFYADVSACCTPVRQRYFKHLLTLPEDRLLLGSDFPVPVFELGSHDFGADFHAVMHGDLERVIIPEDNLLDVNERVLRRFFPGHPLFTNFARLLV